MSRRRLAVAGCVLPWLLAILAGLLLGIASHHLSAGLTLAAGCVIALGLTFVGVPMLILSRAALRRPDEPGESPDELVKAYRSETLLCSSYAHARRVSPTHRKLMALGDAAVPPLLRALERKEGGMHEMALLGALTGAWPAAAAQEPVEGTVFVATNVAQARDLWVAWGRERGLI